MIGNIAGEAVCNHNVAVAVIVKIRHQRRPTPISFLYVCKECYITKHRQGFIRVFAPVKLQCVPHILVFIFVLLRKKIGCVVIGV